MAVVSEILTPGTTGPINDSLDSFAACFCCNPFENLLPDFVALQGQAFDTIVVQSASTGRVATSDFLLNFEQPTSWITGNDDAENCQALLEVVDDALGKVYYPIDYDPVENKSRLRGPPQCNSMIRSEKLKVENETNNQQADDEQGTLRLLAKMLKPGKNMVRYLFVNERRVLGVAVASVFLWSDRDRLVVCDVDGTVTKSNIRGIYDTLLTEKYTYCHDRVCEFLSALTNSNGGEEEENPQEQSVAEQPNINVMYLTSRPLFLAEATRKFLSNLRQSPEVGQQRQMKRRSWMMGRFISTTESTSKTTSPQRPVSPPPPPPPPLAAAATQQSSPQRPQPIKHRARTCPARDSDRENHHRLPDGALIGFPGKLSEVLKMEIVTHDVHLFKAATLMDQVVSTFCRVSEDPARLHKSLFVAGFGNTLMDVQAYHMAGLELSQIYLIDKKSRIHCLDAQPSEEEGGQNQHKWRSRRKSSKKADNNSNAFAVDEAGKSSKKADNNSNTFAINETGNQSCPVLRKPLARKMYKKQVGKVFQGYLDQDLMAHVFAIREKTVA